MKLKILSLLLVGPALFAAEDGSSMETTASGHTIVAQPCDSDADWMDVVAYAQGEIRFPHDSQLVFTQKYLRLFVKSPKCVMGNEHVFSIDGQNVVLWLCSPTDIKWVNAPKAPGWGNAVLRQLRMIIGASRGELALSVVQDSKTSMLYDSYYQQVYTGPDSGKLSSVYFRKLGSNFFGEYVPETDAELFCRYLTEAADLNPEVKSAFLALQGKDIRGGSVDLLSIIRAMAAAKTIKASSDASTGSIRYYITTSAKPETLETVSLCIAAPPAADCAPQKNQTVARPKRARVPRSSGHTSELAQHFALSERAGNK